MKLKKLAVVFSGITAALGMLVTSVPAANATNMVNCGGRTDFYRLINQSGGTTCFANYGDYATGIYNVITLSTGNNNGWVTYRTLAGLWYDSPYRLKWYTGSFSAPVQVFAVHLR